MTGAAKRKPINLHLHDPKKHLSKEDKQDRADAEVTMGSVSFSASGVVKKSKAAFRKWKEITKIYRESGLYLVSSTDNGVLARYCLMYAEYEKLVEQRQLISDLEYPDEIDEVLVITDAEYTRARAKRLWDIMEYFTSLDGVLKLDKAINAKAKSILDIEDRIYLNPAAKVKTLPIKRKPKEKDALGDMGFSV